MREIGGGYIRGAFDFFAVFYGWVTSFFCYIFWVVKVGLRFFAIFFGWLCA